MTIEDELILQCCRRADPEAESRIQDILESGRLNWGSLIRTSVENRVFAQLSDSVATHPATPRNVKLSLAAGCLRLGRQIASVMQAFESALPFIVETNQIVLLRGIEYAYTNNRGRQVRAIGDIDLLIDEPHSASVSGKLSDHYHLPSVVCSHAGQAGGSIEYHHNLNRWNGFSITAINMQELWERRHTTTIGGYDVGILATEDKFVYLCQHNVKKGFVRLYRFLDLAEIIRSAKPDWEKVVKRAREWKLSRVVWINCFALNVLLGETVPSNTMQALGLPRFVEIALRRCFSLQLILHDPNPALRTIESSRATNLRKQLLIHLALINSRNWYKLAMTPIVARALRLYASAYNWPGLGYGLCRIRSVVQGESQ